MWRRAAAAGVLALALVVGVVAGGPVGAATELTLSPASGPPGTEFVITGSGFAALPVEIHWGSQSGPVIAMATGPDFSVSATVPDSPSNSHPVVAVVTDGSAVSTSSASFQVTTGEAPAPVVEDTTTTSTTAAPPTTSPPTTATPVTSPAAFDPPVAGRGGADGGVGGGVDGGVGGTTDGGATTTGAGSTNAAGAPSTGAGSTAPPTASAVPGGDATIPTVTLGPGGAPAAPPGGQVPASAPLLPGDGVAAPALVPGRTNQSAGAVSNPALLFLGLGLVFGGGVFLAVRNRHRA